MKQQNEQSIFTHNQKVCIIRGYYKGYYGKIKGYEQKSKLYDMELKIDNSMETIKVYEQDLRAVKTLFNL